MATISAHVASTSGYKYDVFLSFRGPDTRRTVADVIYESLVDAGISVFRDNEELRKGGNIGPELERAIDDSRIHVPIFSEGYASSAWCLQEFARMVRRQRESAGHEIVPVFYGVSPSNVRLKRGSYGEDLLWHEGRYGEETVRELGKLIKDFVRDVFIKLKKRQKVLPDHLVGIDDRVKDVMQLLDCGSLGVRFLLVHGMGGIGKTTLAKVVFNEIAPLFDGCSFLSDIAGTSQIGGIVKLQNQLLSDILKRSIDVHDVDDGVHMIRERFRNKRVLIILDDVDNREQLTELTGISDWLGPGSRIIVTTRNHAFGETLPPDDLETLSSDIVATTGGIPLALEASGSFLRSKSLKIWTETLERLRKVPDRRVQDTLRISYEALSIEEKQIFLDIACFFNGLESTSAIYVWKDFGYFPESGLATLADMSLLKIDHHNIFRMHDVIRDFGMEIVREENHLNPGSQSRWWEPEECLRILREPIDYQRKRNVTSLWLQFPEVQKITSQELASLPNLRFLRLKRVTIIGDCGNLLPELRWLSLHDCPADFSATNFSPRNLAVLKLSGSELGDDWPGWHQFTKSCELKFLELGECSRLTRLPDLSAIRTLERLTLRDCPSLDQTDESIGKLTRLSCLKVYNCKALRELPKEVGCLNSLKELIVRGTIHGPVGSYRPHSIGNLQSLTRLEMESVGISELPHSIGELKDLQSLCLSRCYVLRKLPDSIGGLESLFELDLSYTKVTELPDSIGNLRKLKVIRIDHSEISKIPSTIGMAEKLEEFHAEKCVNLEGDIPSEIGSLSSLKILNLSHTCIRSVPTTINRLSPLQELHLEGCHELKRVPELPPSLINLYIESRSLTTVPNLSNLINLVNLLVSDYIEESLSNPWDAKSIQTPNLKWVGRLSRLETLKLVHKSIIAPPTELASLPGLKQLVLSCFDLQSLTPPLPSTLSMLKLINFNSLAEFSCSSYLKNLSSLELCKSWLMEIPLNSFGQLENLRELILSNCVFLVRLSSLWGLKKLRVLRLLNCPKLVEIQGLVKLESLESIRIGQCNSLVRLPNLLKLKKLRTMEFLFCRSLVSLPSLSQLALEDCHLVVDRCDKLSNYNGPCWLYKDKRKCPNPHSRL
ncbi:disease resistance protein RPV1-like [Syzygium oleosum]|uniref:disease resistance protein RPV1-like n=1 Tax=Syzygium oleosum TaxID=219896 RepID=UPI0024BB2DED|nr:disease resistance protein RPV1-like [Syzygium oleosum]